MANVNHESNEQNSKASHKKIVDLEKQLAAAQEEHDGLLLESAQISDRRIAELSEQVDQANSLKNEAIAELENERKQVIAGKEREEQTAVREAEAMSKVKELQSVCPAKYFPAQIV
jgi:predicted transcriptional regulator